MARRQAVHLEAAGNKSTKIMGDVRADDKKRLGQPVHFKASVPQTGRAKATKTESPRLRPRAQQ
jgi:hypothetical protein